MPSHTATPNPFVGQQTPDLIRLGVRAALHGIGRTYIASEPKMRQNS